MCDAVTQGIISSIVVGKTAAEEMFTALDITRDAQRNHSVQYRHNDIKGDVHRMYADGEMADSQTVPYAKTLIAIPGIAGQVWLYHKVGADISSYRSKYAPASYSAVPQPPTTAAGPHSIPVPPTVKPVQIPAVTLGTTATPATVTKVTHAQRAATAKSKYVADSRGRLWLPKDKLGKLTLGADGRFNVIKDGQSLIILPKVAGPDPVGKVTDYKVHSHGVALSKMCFKEAGITSNEFDVIEINGHVVIKAA